MVPRNSCGTLLAYTPINIAVYTVVEHNRFCMNVLVVVIDIYLVYVKGIVSHVK